MRTAGAYPSPCAPMAASTLRRSRRSSAAAAIRPRRPSDCRGERRSRGNMKKILTRENKMPTRKLFGNDDTAGDKLVIHTDGGSRGNPGQAAIGVVVGSKEYKERIGVKTNNEAEYLALV